LMTLLGVFLSSLKGVVTWMLLVGNLKLHPFDLLRRMGFLSFLQCLLIAYVLGDWQDCERLLMSLQGLSSLMGFKLSSTWTLFSYEASASTLLAVALFLNGLMAFFLNYVSFTANKKTSALSMTVAGNVKQAVSILLSVWIFHYVISALNGVGILLTLIGGAWYRFFSLFNAVVKELIRHSSFIGLKD
jgi:hypothetical protein